MQIELQALEKLVTPSGVEDFNQFVNDVCDGRIIVRALDLSEVSSSHDKSAAHLELSLPHLGAHRFFCGDCSIHVALAASMSSGNNFLKPSGR
jgi:hypothetical protein